MTYSFIQAIERGHGATYGAMLNAMRSTIRNTDDGLGGGGIVTSLLTMLLTGGSGGGLRQVWLPSLPHGFGYMYYGSRQLHVSLIVFVLIGNHHANAVW